MSTNPHAFTVPFPTVLLASVHIDILPLPSEMQAGCIAALIRGTAADCECGRAGVMCGHSNKTHICSSVWTLLRRRPYECVQIHFNFSFSYFS